MKYTAVRYTVKPQALEENKRLVRAVFTELHERRPHDLHYASIALGDGMFVHLVAAPGDDASELTSLPAFEAFRATIGERVVAAPESFEAEVVGSYAVFAQRLQAK